jgi:hypothetical protein
MGGRTVVDVIAIVLVVAGVGLAGVLPTWRGTILGLVLQYLGVAIVLFVVSGLVAGVVGVVTAIGIVSIFATDQGWSLRAELWLVNPFTDEDAKRDDPLDVELDQPLRRVRHWRSGPAGGPTRLFELSVITLAVLGALGIAIGRPTFGAFGADAIIGVLVLTGVLYCLLGGAPRWTGGLLFLGSAVNVLLHEASPMVGPLETLLDAAAQIALAISLVYVRARETEAGAASQPGLEPAPAEPVAAAPAAMPEDGSP